jgi:hypothetical protein
LGRAFPSLENRDHFLTCPLYVIRSAMLWPDLATSDPLNTLLQSSVTSYSSLAKVIRPHSRTVKEQARCRPWEGK